MATLVPVTIQVPKELNDLSVALVALVNDVKAKKPFVTVVADTFPLLLAAVAGAQSLPDEVKSEVAKSAAAIGLLGGELVGALFA